MLSMRKVHQYYVDNETVGKVFVIDGVVVNGFDTPKALIAVEAAIYDKNKKECFEVEKGFIENDFGGMPFQPTTSVAPNVLVNFLNAERIFMYAEQEDASVLEHPQLKNLNEEDNPVLMVVYLKEK